MPPSAHLAVNRIAQCTVEPLLGGISMAGLAALLDSAHEAMAPIDYDCSQGCGTHLRGPRFFAALTACDDCRAKAQKADRLEKAKLYWESICPVSFRETKKDHPGFPLAQYNATKAFLGGESLLFFGPTGQGKTRLAMWLLKRCLVRSNLHVGVLWPWDLKAVKKAFDVREQLTKWGKFDLLLMDDSLMTGAQDERITDFLKDLFSYRMDHHRHQIITSQIGGDEYKQQADKFENITAADLKRVEALLRRLREVCRLVSFAEATPKQGEQQF